ncbi:MAG: crotonase/enoyl-CoA hydratase family protein [Gammaproteobacteria bacterium]|jgi:enoyl-CoA hydratase
MTDTIAFALDGPVAVLKLDDGKANAFSFDFIERVNRSLDRAIGEAQAVAIIGRPGLLSGGFDLGVVKAGDAAEIARLVTAGARLMMRLYGHPQPLVVGATGHAVALGAFMLLCADYRVGVSGDFKIGLNETAIGLTLPAFGIALAQERLSKRRLTQATIGATLYDPEDACDTGFLDEVTNVDSLLETVVEHAATMAKLDGPAFAASKRMLRGATIDRIIAGLG